MLKNKFFSFKIGRLYHGKWPEVDENLKPFEKTPQNRHRIKMAGKWLANGTCGYLTELLGDWKFLKEALNLKQHYNTRFICPWCWASKLRGVLNFAHFCADAAHFLPENQRNTEDYFASFVEHLIPWLSYILPLLTTTYYY